MVNDLCKCGHKRFDHDLQFDYNLNIKNPCYECQCKEFKQHDKITKDKKNLLFICEGNTQRSPTFEIWFKRKRRNEYNVKSTGTAYGYSERLNEELLAWVDKIFLMDLEQEIFMSRKFPQFLFKCEIIGCSDQYSRESLQLYLLIEHWVKKRGL